MKTSSIAVETSQSTTQSDSIVRQTNKRSSYTTMNNKHIFNDIELKYGCTALRLIRRHERCSRKLARYNNHLTFLTRCIKSHIIPRDLRVQPPVPTKGACRVAELASMRFLRERIRLTQRAKGDAKKKLNPLPGT